MLHDFLVANRTTLLDRYWNRVGGRTAPRALSSESGHGAPVFLDQLIAALRREQKSARLARASGLAAADKGSEVEVAQIAALHGRDLFEQGFTIEQVTREYGDICQTITALALETAASIDVGEFRTFNRCLDDAIAGAVAEYSRRGSQTSDLHTKELRSRLGHLAHELRNHVHTASLVAKAISAGNAGMSGAASAVLDRSLRGMRSLIDRALTEVRGTKRMPPRQEIIALATFLNNIKSSASFDALARERSFAMAPIAANLYVYADSEMLEGAISNLLQNAFKLTKHCTEVQMKAYASDDRVLIEIEDQCGGLPPGAAESMFLPFVQNGEDRSGLGLGLDIARRGVEANGGSLRVRDIPNSGCVFTIDLPGVNNVTRG